MTTRECALPFGATFRIHPDAKLTEVIFSDGRVVGGSRPPDFDNCAQAAELGYTGDADGCWRALVCHEALHCIVAADLWSAAADFPNTGSYALRHEAGDPRPYALRLWEESIVLSAELWFNTGDLLLPIDDFFLDGFLESWRRQLDEALAALGMARG